MRVPFVGTAHMAASDHPARREGDGVDVKGPGSDAFLPSLRADVNGGTDGKPDHRAAEQRPEQNYPIALISKGNARRDGGRWQFFVCPNGRKPGLMAVIYGV